MMGLEFSFFNLEVIGKFIWDGLWFSVYLTIIATLGGIFFGTVLALNNDAVLLLGGTGSDGRPLNDAWLLDVAALSWRCAA